MLTWDQPDHENELDNITLKSCACTGNGPCNAKKGPGYAPHFTIYNRDNNTGQYWFLEAGMDTMTGGPVWCLKLWKDIVTLSWVILTCWHCTLFLELVISPILMKPWNINMHIHLNNATSYAEWHTLKLCITECSRSYATTYGPIFRMLSLYPSYISFEPQTPLQREDWKYK